MTEVINFKERKAQRMYELVEALRENPDILEMLLDDIRPDLIRRILEQEGYTPEEIEHLEDTL
jgi:hypothetical protein